MSPDLQLQYLDAMGIQLWQERDKPVVVVEQQATFVSEEPEQVPDNTSAVESSSLESEVENCTACELFHNRQHVVISEGKTGARFMFVTLAPEGEQFMTQAAVELFTKMINAINLQRDEIFITSLLKCPPDSHREPRTTELLCCEAYLHRQVETVKPDLVIALGEKVAQHLLVSKKPLDELRQAAYQYQNIPVMALHHPEDLLNNPEDKRKAWHDLQKIQRDYDL